jgi:hypothetical protein
VEVEYQLEAFTVFITKICQHLVPKMLTPKHKETKITLAMADQDVDFLT